MIDDTPKAFEKIKEKYNLVQRERTYLDTWTFSDAINAKGFVVEYKLGLRFANKCYYDADDDVIKFIGIVPIELSDYDYKMKTLREMFDNAQIKMKQHRMKIKIEKIEGDFE